MVVTDALEIRVHNPGRVPTVVESRFFEKYVSHGKAHGAGLGTYSAKLIAEAHGGTASMQSSDEKGTVVTLHFPRQPSELLLKKVRELFSNKTA